MSNYKDNTGASGWASYIRSYSNPSADYSSYLTFGTSPTSIGGPSERMRITTDGNIGIGTTSPGAKLDVAGTINISNGSANLRRLSFDASGVYYNWIESGGSVGAGYMAFAAGNSEVMRIITGGNVGIGTSSPGHLLSIYGTPVLDGALNVVQKISSNASYLTAPTSGIGFGANWASGGNNAVLSGIAGGKENTNNSDFAGVLIFYTRPNGGNHTEHMRITSVGNVGIGTTNPVAKLHIRGGTELLNTSGSTGSTTSGSLMIVGQNTKGGANYHDFLYTKNSKTTLNPNKHFRLDNIGNLEIINSAYTSAIFTLTDSGSLLLPTAQSRNVTQLRNTGAGLKVGNFGLLFDDGNVHLHSTSPGTNLWLNCSGSGMFVVNGQTGATNGMCVGTSTQSGFVTIVGSKSVSIAQPYGYLISSGAGSTTGTSPNPYSLTCDSRIMSSEFNAPSDERLKNIRGEISLDKAIDFVTKVDPIEFTWKEGIDTGLKAGYSAQQTYKAGFEHLIGVVPKQGIPEVVESDGFVSPKDAQFVMNYEQVTPYHSKLIKHLLDKVEKLEKELELLKNRL
jgi:hypothetical protein